MMKTYLAVDFGLKRVGLAISRLWLSEPLAVIDTSKAAKEVGRIVEEERVDEVLVGLPDGAIAEHALAFSEKLKKELRVPVKTVDETLSTKESDALVQRSGMPRSKRQLPKDHYAAAVFLQDYLDTHKED